MRNEPWPTADDLVWSLGQRAAAGMPTASCRRTVAIPAHTDCCVSTKTTVPSRETVVLDRVAGMSSD